MKAFLWGLWRGSSETAFDDTAEWELWKKKHGKQYSTDKEELHRRTVWKANKKKVQEHNAHADKWGWTLEMNALADMESSEFAAKYNGFGQSEKRDDTHNHVPGGGSLLAVKNQKQYGSCWAFSATGSLEGQTSLKKGTLPNLSEQQLAVDCSKKYGNHGCQGGFMDNAFKYIKAIGGIDSEASYPYKAKNDKCRFQQSAVAATCTGYVEIPRGDIDALMDAVANVGPISVAMDASYSSFQLHAEGVYDPFLCSSSHLNHSVLTVGYGSEPIAESSTGRRTTGL